MHVSAQHWILIVDTDTIHPPFLIPDGAIMTVRPDFYPRRILTLLQ
jgi:hypothetical protein